MPGRRLRPRAVPLSGQRLALLRRDLPLDVEIRLVADNHDRNPVGALDRCGSVGEPRTGTTATYKVIQDLVPDDLDHFKRRLGRNRVDQHVAVNADRVSRVQDAVFILRGYGQWTDGSLIRKETHLASGIYDLGRIFLTLELDGS